MSDDPKADALAYVGKLIDDKKVFVITQLDAVPPEIRARVESHEFDEHFCGPTCPMMWVDGMGLVCSE